ncbi:MAG: hypothetical protein JKY66_06135 [Spongiibacteraceae bacterium]|nr:hypothetical protein [Spongiibacteraceae bacterium]
MGRLELILTGLLGLTLMASTVTGIIIHRKTLKELFVFRPIRSLTIYGWGDKNALAYTFGGDAMPTQSHKFKLNSGEHQNSDTAFALVGGASGPILDVMFPLHYGNIGGLLVRVVWALLGLST